MDARPARVCSTTRSSRRRRRGRPVPAGAPPTFGFLGQVERGEGDPHAGPRVRGGGDRRTRGSSWPGGAPTSTRWPTCPASTTAAGSTPPAARRCTPRSTRSSCRRSGRTRRRSSSTRRGRAGITVIGARAGGIPELIAPASEPLLFPSGDAGALAARLRSFAADPDRFAAPPEAAPLDWAGHLAGRDPRVRRRTRRGRRHGAWASLTPRGGSLFRWAWESPRGAATPATSRTGTESASERLRRGLDSPPLVLGVLGVLALGVVAPVRVPIGPVGRRGPLGQHRPAAARPADARRCATTAHRRSTTCSSTAGCGSSGSGPAAVRALSGVAGHADADPDVVHRPPPRRPSAPARARAGRQPERRRVERAAAPRALAVRDPVLHRGADVRAA